MVSKTVVCEHKTTSLASSPSSTWILSLSLVRSSGVPSVKLRHPAVGTVVHDPIGERVNWVNATPGRRSQENDRQRATRLSLRSQWAREGKNSFRGTGRDTAARTVKSTQMDTTTHLQDHQGERDRHVDADTPAETHAQTRAQGTGIRVHVGNSCTDQHKRTTTLDRQGHSPKQRMNNSLLICQRKC